MTPRKLAKLLPKHVRIGGFKFKITLQEDWIVDKGKNYWGMFHPADEVISLGNIKSITSSRFLVGILWHELYHGMWYAQALGSRAKEEEAARSFEQAFISLCIDNPWLLPWTMKGLK